MHTTPSEAPDTQPPKITGRDARIAQLMRAAHRTVPLRHTFVQAVRGSASRHAPLREFVRGGDLRGLRALLLVMAASGGKDQDGHHVTTHDSMVWARLLDTDLGVSGQSARTGAWRVLRRLEDRGLVVCERPRGSTRISVTLLREDGTGAPYTWPDGQTEADRFLRLPTAFWTNGHDEAIDVPGLAMLLALAKEKPWSSFPAEQAPAWYGWSADTQLRGLQTLVTTGLAERRATYEPAPLSPTGATLVYRYRLVDWLRPPRGRKQGGDHSSGQAVTR
ncbi:hypothetical protein ACIQGZ_00155 [Streptomyces sp. NPDC092296]|uniref:hypothetical protein n=1 Tax=Streptomyces sp. NPDC092296 TaxID=3366012 RepID=UPI0037FB3D8C